MTAKVKFSPSYLPADSVTSERIYILNILNIFNIRSGHIHTVIRNSQRQNLNPQIEDMIIIIHVIL